MPNSGHIILALIFLAVMIAVYLTTRDRPQYACLVCATKVRRSDQFIIAQFLDEDEHLFKAKIPLCLEHITLDDDELGRVVCDKIALPTWVGIQIQRKDDQA